MPSERDEDKDDESTQGAEASADGDASERDDDAEESESEASAAADDDSDEDSDEDERENDEEDDGEGEQRILTGPVDDTQPEEDLPRNRAERRVRARQARRGQLQKTTGADADTATRRPRLPPKTISGKSSADEIPPWARGAADWLIKSAKGLALGAVLVLAVAGGAIFWTWHRDDQLAKAASAYRDAVEVSVAPIRAADAPPEPPSALPRHTPTFADRAARSQAALRAFREVSNRYGSSPVAPLARLSEATTLYDLGRYAEARTVFQGLLSSDTAGQEPRVLEGLGFTLEALNDNAGALARFQELGRIQDGAFRDLATFHQARVEVKLSHTDRARELLHGLIERLRRTSTDETLGTGGTVLEEGQMLLRDIAPEDPMAVVESPAGNDPEALMRQLQQRFGNQVHIQRPGGSAPRAPAPPSGGSQ